MIIEYLQSPSLGECHDGRRDKDNSCKRKRRWRRMTSKPRVKVKSNSNRQVFLKQNNKVQLVRNRGYVHFFSFLSGQQGRSMQGKDQRLSDWSATGGGLWSGKTFRRFRGVLLHKNLRNSKTFLFFFFLQSTLYVSSPPHLLLISRLLTICVPCRLHRIISIVNVLIRVSYQSHGFHNLADDLKSSIP
jgi:hypothetical protein